MIKQFFIVNRSGGLVYKYEKVHTKDDNSLLVLTSTLHALNEMMRHALGNTYYKQEIRMEEETLWLFRTLTGSMFIFACKNDPQQAFERIYCHYSDYVQGNTFYVDEMPINCRKFEPEQYFDAINAQ
ncbi:trafficking protein particle complex subunit 4 [Enteropsectra breve]|nr:trafficking protein particle complex subunit 4 [Enteropsectra breve]